jgi:periplasmic protein TonB
MAFSTPHYVSVSRTSSLTSIAAVVALHVVILGLLSQLAPVRSALNASNPVIVSLLTAPHEEPQTLPKPLPAKPLPPKPREHRVERSRPPPPVAPVIAATPVAPTASAITPPPEPAPAPPVEAAAPPPVGALASAAPPAPVPAPLTPPSFNAAYLNNPAPAYPTLSRRMHEEGKVVLRVFVNESGLPQDVQLKSSSGSNRLDSTAVDTVKQWKFVPARRGDTPIGAWVLVPISFSLRS